MVTNLGLNATDIVFHGNNEISWNDQNSLFLSLKNQYDLTFCTFPKTAETLSLDRLAVNITIGICMGYFFFGAVHTAHFFSNKIKLILHYDYTSSATDLDRLKLIILLISKYDTAVIRATALVQC